MIEKIIRAFIYLTLIIIGLPILFFFVYIASIMISLKLNDHTLSQNINNNQYNEICLAQSYDIGFGKNIPPKTVQIDDRIISVPNLHIVGGADDGVWVIIGLQENQENESFAIDRKAVLNYFDNHDNQCKKL